MIWHKTLPVSPVTLEELKAHLHIDDDFEDASLSQYLLAATQDAEHILQREIIRREDLEALAEDATTVPAVVKQYVLCLAGDMFANRELSGEKQLSVHFAHLLDPFILYDRALEEESG